MSVGECMVNGPSKTGEHSSLHMRLAKDPELNRPRLGKVILLFPA